LDIAPGWFCHNWCGEPIQLDCTASGWYFEGKLGGLINETNAWIRIMVLMNVKRAAFEEFMIAKVIPEIFRKCPAEMVDNRIYIQLDNLTPHTIDLICNGVFYWTSQ
jgi:hypothetical protein